MSRHVHSVKNPYGRVVATCTAGGREQLSPTIGKQNRMPERNELAIEINSANAKIQMQKSRCKNPDAKIS